MAERLQIQLAPIQRCDLSLIQQQWLNLEQKANNSIFTSWHFINTWIEYIDFKGKLLTVSFKDEIVGLAIIVEHAYCYHGLKVKQLWLNRTGDTVDDQIWNEYNDILCAHGLEHAIRSAVIDYFEQHLIEYDELIIGVCKNNIKETPISQNMMQHTSWQAMSYQRNIRPEYANWSTFLNSLSANTRYQIKRSAKLYGGMTQIQFTNAVDVTQAITFFKEAGEFHKVRWANHNSGFNNPRFVEFHTKFITSNFHLNIIDLVKVQVNADVIGYLYNYLYKGTVYFYLSGFIYAPDNKLKPGLLAHSMAISHYAKKGFEIYDFMGGDGRYKESLADQTDELIVSNFRRKTVPFLLSNALRTIKSLYA